MKIVQDLLIESDKAILELHEANFGQEAHEIKGDASFLHCKQIYCYVIIQKIVMLSLKFTTDNEIN